MRTLFGYAVLGTAIAAVIFNLSDIKRYMRMRSM